MGHGGLRPGAGRFALPEEKKGYPQLSHVETRALRGLHYRVAPDTHPVLGDIADSALIRMIDVMNEQVDPVHAGNVLKAASMIRDEICGPIAKKVELKMGLAEMLALASEPEEEGEFTVLADPAVTVDALPDPETKMAPAPTGAGAEGPAGVIVRKGQ